MIKIVHASDLHGNFIQLPPADIYIFTGDICPTFPLLHFTDIHQLVADSVKWDVKGGLAGFPPGARPPGYCAHEEIDWVHDRTRQTQWLQLRGGFRKYLDNPDAPVITVRGNHDRIDLNQLFGGEVYEIHGDEFCEPITIKGLTFGGTRGINQINGHWEDEYTPEKWLEQYDYLESKLAEIDVLLTHCPPFEILDEGFQHWGNKEVRRYVDWRNQRHYYENKKHLQLHCFGHVHEQGQQTMVNGETIFSNAATGFNVIKLG
jgi:Icc-related predicted phosphoesterase